MFSWKKIKPPAHNSLIDIREVEFDFLMADGSETQLSNPLGTSYDMADMIIDGEGDWLDCSPYLYVWDETLTSIYKSQTGIWLCCTDRNLVLRFGSGQPPEKSEHTDMYCFFPIPENFHETRQSMRHAVTCMN